MLYSKPILPELSSKVLEKNTVTTTAATGPGGLEEIFTFATTGPADGQSFKFSTISEEHVENKWQPYFNLNGTVGAAVAEIFNLTLNSTPADGQSFKFSTLSGVTEHKWQPYFNFGGTINHGGLAEIFTTGFTSAPTDGQSFGFSTIASDGITEHKWQIVIGDSSTPTTPLAGYTAVALPDADLADQSALNAWALANLNGEATILLGTPVTITNTYIGAVTAPNANDVPATITVTQIGAFNVAPPTPAPGYTLIELTSGEGFTSDIETATSNEVVITGSYTFTNATAGAVTAPADVDSGAVIVVSQLGGPGIPVPTPAAGYTLIEIDTLESMPSVIDTQTNNEVAVTGTSSPWTFTNENTGAVTAPADVDTGATIIVTQVGADGSTTIGGKSWKFSTIDATGAVRHYQVWYSDGDDLMPSITAGYFPFQILISDSDTANQVAAETAAQLNKAPNILYNANITVSTNVVTIQNYWPGAVAHAADVDTGFTVTNVTAGTADLTTNATAAGTYSYLAPVGTWTYVNQLQITVSNVTNMGHFGGEAGALTNGFQLGFYDRLGNLLTPLTAVIKTNAQLQQASTTPAPVDALGNLSVTINMNEAFGQQVGILGQDGYVALVTGDTLSATTTFGVTLFGHT